MWFKSYRKRQNAAHVKRMICAMYIRPQTFGWLAAGITVTIWTSFIVIARASATLNLNPLDIVFVRIVGAGVVLLPWMLISNRYKAQTERSFFGLSPLPWKTTVITGVLGSVLFASLAYSGFFFAPAAHASVLLPGGLPLWTAVLAVTILKEHVSRSRGIGLACILCGGLLVGGESLLQAFDGGHVWKGDLLFMCASFCYSTYGIVVRSKGLDPINATVGLTVFSVMTFLPIYGVLAWTGLVASNLATTPISEMAFQALFQGGLSVVVAGISFNVMIRTFGPIRTTMLTALVPGLSALGAVVFLGEPLLLNLILGLALVTTGILIGARKA